MADTAELFSGKQHVYDMHRPHYPDVIIDAVEKALPDNAVLADIGSGTGFLSIPLAQAVKKVFAIEPNADLREAHRNKILECPEARDRTELLDTKAQSTGLLKGSVDHITLGNVAHWLDGKEEKRLSCLKEFNRIAKSDAQLSVVSLSPSIKNNWLMAVFDLAKEYDPEFDIPRIFKTFSSYEDHAKSFIDKLNGHEQANLSRTMDKTDFFDFLLSMSFCDDNMRKEIEAIFKLYSSAGYIEAKFDSSVYTGPLLNV